MRKENDINRMIRILARIINKCESGHSTSDIKMFCLRVKEDIEGADLQDKTK
jgi:hypothetical protein